LEEQASTETELIDKKNKNEESKNDDESEWYLPRVYYAGKVTPQLRMVDSRG
jgi:hypothetical protein